MAGKTREESNIDKLRELASQTGCDSNPLFATALDQYVVQLRVIDLIRHELDNADLAVSKEYVKGRENLYAHPLVKELPKHSDSATKTAAFLWNMIRDSMPRQGSDQFDDCLGERDQM